MDSNLYAVLDIQEDATGDAVRRAYRRIALKLHPDKNGGVRSPEFDRVQAAYEILGDEKLRKVYDHSWGRVSSLWRRRWQSNPEGDMADRMAKAAERRQADMEQWKERKRRQADEARRREREEEDAEIQKLMEQARLQTEEWAEQCTNHIEKCKLRKETEDAWEDELEDLTHELQKRRQQNMQDNSDAREREKRRAQEDLEWLRTAWESALDDEIDSDARRYERERTDCSIQMAMQENAQMQEVDDLVAQAKAEMEALMKAVG
ncbi:hypothetical protein CYMTET_53623 [Cymbomonas tetramitiformis]|uniref:J domain-containing protein n=1 Tax=Cymbomonas tetramitiformis TaxID=36881 RepID=A0AAE0BGU1_9CHLO|nr:hypothetical protein CYMTET_53623 [Cymbomonas tetramitiformis]